jgi:heme exporter protein D
MISVLLLMKGYGLYVWSAFLFTLFSFLVLFLITKTQYVKEKSKFISKFGALDSKKAEVARSQTINREILSRTSNI